MTDHTTQPSYAEVVATPSIAAELLTLMAGLTTVAVHLLTAIGLALLVAIGKIPANAAFVGLVGVALNGAGAGGGYEWLRGRLQLAAFKRRGRTAS